MVKPFNARTDEQIRVDFLVNSGLSLDNARRYVGDHPKASTTAEASAILSERFRDLARVLCAAVEELLARSGLRR